jgi:hypothetical protein
VTVLRGVPGVDIAGGVVGTRLLGKTKDVGGVVTIGGPPMTAVGDARDVSGPAMVGRTTPSGPTPGIPVTELLVTIVDDTGGLVSCKI